MPRVATKQARIPEEPRLSEAEFLNVLSALPEWTLEYSAEGILTFMPPTDPVTSSRNSLIVHRLVAWSEKSGRGMVCGPDGGFFLKDLSRRSPDAAWFDAKRWNDAQVPGLTFPPFTPEFVFELRSRMDRLKNLQEKMVNYIDNGVQLGWLIDPAELTVTIYRPNQDPEVLANPAEVKGDGPVDGFVLSMLQIFPVADAA